MKEKHPRIIIRHLDGDCVVELYDKENLLILQQPVIDEDPYLFISRLRESIDGAHISEEPELKCAKMDSQFTAHKEHPFVTALKGQIQMYQEMLKQMSAYADSLERPERSFTDNLT